jgi:hypothetical protein
MALRPFWKALFIQSWSFTFLLIKGHWFTGTPRASVRFEKDH